MFGELLESRPRQARRGKVAAASVVAHAVVLFAAAIATKNADAGPPDEAPPRDVIHRWHVPEPVEPSPPTEARAAVPRPTSPPRSPIPPVTIPDGLPPIDVPLGPTGNLGLDDPGELGPTSSPAGAIGGTDSPAGDGVFPLGSPLVDKPAVLAPGNAQPRYPEPLRRASVAGLVVTEFVVDTTGHAEMASLRLVRSDHELFASAVRAALPRMRFVPAEARGRKVRQLVRVPFAFELEGAR
jgi:periplasmic protein TonB